MEHDFSNLSPSRQLEEVARLSPCRSPKRLARRVAARRKPTGGAGWWISASMRANLNARGEIKIELRTPVAAPPQVRLVLLCDVFGIH